MIPNLASLFIRQQLDSAAEWLSGQRERYRQMGRPLDADEYVRFAPYFAPSTLDRVRIVVAERATEAPVLGAAALSGFAAFFELGSFDGITFGDTIVIKGGQRHGTDAWYALLFHEIVHAIQYEELGIPEFARRYAGGWISEGMSYSKIPLEVDAYDLQRRFECETEPFAVEDAVRARLAVSSATDARTS